MKKIDRRWGFGKKEVSLGMILLGLGLFLFAPLRAQQEAKAVFVSMPDSLSPLLTAVNRADFIDFLDSKMKAKVENRFGGESEMDGSEQRLYSYPDDSAKFLARKLLAC